MNKKTIGIANETKVTAVECNICHKFVTGGVLSSYGAICYGCADIIGSNNMTKKTTVSKGIVKGKKAPKPLTLREKGIGPNLCINIPIVKENKKLMDAIATYRKAYHISMNNLLFLALGRFLGLKEIKFS